MDGSCHVCLSKCGMDFVAAGCTHAHAGPVAVGMMLAGKHARACMCDPWVMQALSIARDIASGLAYLHPVLVHRDLK